MSKNMPLPQNKKKKKKKKKKIKRFCFDQKTPTPMTSFNPTRDAFFFGSQILCLRGQLFPVVLLKGV